MHCVCATYKSSKASELQEHLNLIYMKHISLFTFLILGISFTGFSQEKEPQKKERIKLYHMSKEEANPNGLSPEKEIEQCESHLEALDIKEEKIRQSPEETKIATENGWFIQAEQTRKELKARIEELKKK